ncbi:endothelin-converting enzyme [Bernardetia litoralis DSM 6794]|uniref:Endothelin-converting enzyme n=1 Tax=Bernardetia litoralis (strain ATCC 23117 / DSM 6794 / NBRC 15988 / NCIMB 1366 / Fx l1 / Sio-4) TaxID=880071 RepID=I4AJ26_BERLS|nr:M13 family metallopeptidase [Bernardetia litoralis]AFM03961.1 endothelin-converting enzyme [Bernardetia litoralis DSM 6794]
MKHSIYKIGAVTLGLTIGLGLTSCNEPQKTTAETTETTETEEATNKKPTDYLAIDLANFDTTVRPQDDFFMFVNGSWLKNNPIPASETRWTSFSEILEKNREILKRVAENAAANTSASPTSAEGQVAAFYKSGTNEQKREELGMKPMEIHLEAINKATTLEEFLKVSADQKAVAGGLFSVYVTADEKNSSTNALYMNQGGTSLPKAYYETSDLKEKFAAFEKHVANMFVLMGETPEVAATKAKNVVAIETELAKVSRTPAERRDSEKNYNKMTFAELQKLSPNVDWKKHLSDIGVQNIETVENVILGTPEFFTGLSKTLKNNSLDALKDYQKYHLAGSFSSFLNKDFEKEDFDFYNKTMRGQNEMQERWKLVLNVIDRSIGHSLGQLYVKEAFSPKAKERAEVMIQDVRASFEDHIKGLEWMGEDTKKQALAKLSSITTKIGYPDAWKTYEGLELSEDNYAQNFMNASKWWQKDNLSKLGKPVDKSEWHMTPSTVNAYYNPTSNEIVFPAGILQPPFFSEYADDAVNYGGIGAVIGHEISHGFDDQGSQYDAEGNMNNWWTDTDKSQFKEKTTSLVAQYSEYTVLDDIKVKGDATLGENIADLGGMAVAYDALKKAWARDGKPEQEDNLTPEQRFFVSWAQIWRVNFTDDELRNRIETDYHSPGMFRANGPLSNFNPFFEAFDVKEGDKMRREDQIVIW